MATSGRPLPELDRRMILRLRGQRLTVRQIASAVTCSPVTVLKYLKSEKISETGFAKCNKNME